MLRFKLRLFPALCLSNLVAHYCKGIFTLKSPLKIKFEVKTKSPSSLAEPGLNEKAQAWTRWACLRSTPTGPFFVISYNLSMILWKKYDSPRLRPKPGRLKTSRHKTIVNNLPEKNSSSNVSKKLNWKSPPVKILQMFFFILIKMISA